MDLSDKYTNMIMEIRWLSEDKKWQVKNAKITASYRRAGEDEIIIPIDTYRAWDGSVKCCLFLVDAL